MENVQVMKNAVKVSEGNTQVPFLAFKLCFDQFFNSQFHFIRGTYAIRHWVRKKNIKVSITPYQLSALFATLSVFQQQMPYYIQLHLICSDWNEKLAALLRFHQQWLETQLHKGAMTGYGGSTHEMLRSRTRSTCPHLAHNWRLVASLTWQWRSLVKDGTSVLDAVHSGHSRVLRNTSTNVALRCTMFSQPLDHLL